MYDAFLKFEYRRMDELLSVADPALQEFAQRSQARFEPGDYNSPNRLLYCPPKGDSIDRIIHLTITPMESSKLNTDEFFLHISATSDAGGSRIDFHRQCKQLTHLDLLDHERLMKMLNAAYEELNGIVMKDLRLS